MAGEEPAPGGAGEEPAPGGAGEEPAPGGDGKSGRDKAQRGMGKFLGILSMPWWLGVGAIVAIVGVVVAVMAIPSSEQRAKANSPAPIRFSDVSSITLSHFGLIFFYPSGWDLQPASGNLYGEESVNPDDRSVIIIAYGTRGSLGSSPPIFDPENVTIETPRIVEQAPSGWLIKSPKGMSTVNGWRVLYQYVDDRGNSVTEIVKTAVANGREVALIMEAPTKEFWRYKDAFLELSGKMLLLTRCDLCSVQ